MLLHMFWINYIWENIQTKEAERVVCRHEKHCDLNLTDTNTKLWLIKVTWLYAIGAV